MKYLTYILCLTSCVKSSEELEEITAEVLKRKEGVDIKIIPVQEDK